LSRIIKDYKCPNCKGWNDVSEIGDNEIMKKENAILELQDRDRPDMIMIDGKEV